jgi:DNA-directed RNA polymerase subunit K/omega
MAIKTIDVNKLAEKTGSLYEAVAIISKRARQIASKMKSELDEKLSYFEGFGTEGDDVYMNEEQARVSIEFEKRPKPTEVAINEMFADEIYYRNPSEDQ